MKIKLVLSIRSVDIGGAERQFIELVKNIDKNKFEIIVCTMYGGIQENILKSISNIKYYNLHKKGRYDFYNFFKKYIGILKKEKPDVIYSFMDGMNIINILTNIFLKKKTKIIWGIRSSNVDIKKYGKFAEIIFLLQKRFSYKADLIIANSLASVVYYKNLGFSMNKSVVIHNGIDIELYKRNDEYRKIFRNNFNIKGNDIVLGICARIDYMKGYPILASAAKKILSEFENVYFFSAGESAKGFEHIKKECEDILGRFNNSRFIWLGKQKEMQKIYSGWDVYISSSSFGEGFSNSIGEAMACEVPCIATDVGDSKIIVGDTGIIGNPNHIESLYLGIKKMLSSDLTLLGKKARERIVQNFFTDKMIKETEENIYKLVNL
jgi:glycosyltransferase involved in cell wall biosynthesis